MPLFQDILQEALADHTFTLAGALVVTLAITRALVPREERRTAGTIMLFLCHLALVPVAGWLRTGMAAQELHDASGVYGDVRLAALILAAMTAIGMFGQLVFEILLPRVRLPAPRILRDLSTAGASLIAVFAIASRLGFNLSGIIATSAVVTAVIGFSLQDTLGNIMGGLALQLDNSISVGDWIKIGEVNGRVTEIRWRYTAVETRNWETLIFPNSMLMKSEVTVLGRRSGKPQQWRRWIWFHVGYEHSPSEVMLNVNEALQYAPIERVALDPAPHCILMDLGDSSGKYAVRYWLTDLAVDDPTDSAVRARIYFALKRLNIPFSLPAQHLYLHDWSRRGRDEEHETREFDHRMALLQQLELFGELDEEERVHIARALKFAPFGRGETLTKQGNAAHWLYVIFSGKVSVRVAVEGGLEREVSQLSGPAFVGEMGLLTGESRTATIVAVSDVECYRLDKTAFQRILQERPALAGKVADVLTRRKVELDAVKEGLSSEAKERRAREFSAQVLGKIRDFFGI